MRKTRRYGVDLFISSEASQVPGMGCLGFTPNFFLPVTLKKDAMKKLLVKGLTMISLLFAPVCLLAQHPCKYVKPQKDQFTNETYNMAKMAIGAPMAMRELIIYETNGKFNVGLRMTFNTDFPEVAFKKGDKVSIKLANGEVLAITSEKDLPPTTIRVLDVPLRQWYINQQVSRAVFEKLSASTITAVRVRLNEADHDLQGVKEKQAEKIMETVKCLLENTK
ncbi:MAG: hypothetical protein J0L80_01805 [Chitinophagales bacterium]|nr:hypothetical protein [Chitinophagales bacterium]